MRRELGTWLNAIRPNAMYDGVLQKKLAGTCDWILERSAFKEWELEVTPPEHAKLLWITGPAGYGKTVLSASIIQHLQDLDQSPFYFFFSADLEDRSDPFIVLRSWISQLVSSSQDAFDAVWEDQVIDAAGKASRRQIEALFKKLAARIPNSVFIVDGLDECTEKGGWSNLKSQSLASFVQALVDAVAGSTARILIVSREQQDVRDGLTSATSLCFTEYKISEEDVRPDATLLSRSIVSRKLSNKSQAVQDGIVEKMVDSSRSMLLHIKLLENDLRGGKNQNQLERILSQAPGQLATLYDRNWQRIVDNDTDRSRALAILRWATFAQRSMTVYEITEALLVEDDDAEESLRENMPDAIDEEFVKTEIIDLCHSLVETRVNESSPDIGARTVHMTHFTVREYLLQRDPVTGSAKTLQANEGLHRSHEFEHNLMLADVCLRYIKIGWIWASDSDQQEVHTEGAEPIRYGHFRDYAARSWPQHVRSVSIVHKRTFQSIKEFFNAGDKTWEHWRRYIDGTPLISSHVEHGGGLTTANRLFYAAYFGFSDLVQHMVESANVDVNQVDASQRTALFAAAVQGHTLMTTYLLGKNADVELAGEGMNTPLVAACQLGRLEVARLLVEAAPQIVNSIGNGETPLSMATWMAHKDIAKLLLEKGADPDAPSSDSMLPIHNAATRGCLELVKLLLDHGAGLNIQSSTGMNALHYAANNGHAEVVKLLLDRGADHSAVDTTDNSTCLWTAASGGHVDVVALLLDEDADHSFLGGKQKSTPLLMAACDGHSAIVQLLVDKGADFTIADEDGWKPITAAACNGHAEVVELLIQRGNGWEMRGEDGYTPLHEASSNGHLRVVALLLKRGANCNSLTMSGQTPMALAAIQGHIDIVRCLLEQGADHSIAAGRGWTPLAMAAGNGHIDIVRYLLDQGADCVDVKVDGWSTLQLAANEGHMDVVKVLLDNGADISFTDDDGVTALYHACMSGHPDIAELLIKHGAGFDINTNDGWELWTDLARGSHIEMLKLLIRYNNGVSPTPVKARPSPLHYARNLKTAQLLLDAGASVSAHTSYGEQPLHWAAQEGRIEIIRFLVERGADLSAKDAGGRTPVFFAASRGHLDVFDLSLGSPAEVNKRDMYQATPLAVAAHFGHRDMVEHLLSLPGVDACTQDRFGRTALSWAHAAGHATIVELLSSRLEGPASSAGESRDEDDEPLVLVTAGTVSCDVCMGPVWKGGYHCGVCRHDGFDICSYCKAAGAHCLDRNHVLEKRDGY